MNLETGKVYSFIISSGQEIIGKVASINDTEIVIQNPVTIGMGPKGPVLMNAFQTVNPEAETRLNTNIIAMYAESDDDIKDKILELTTGLQVPPQKKILVG